MIGTAIFRLHVSLLLVTFNVLVPLSISPKVYGGATPEEKAINQVIAWHPTERHVPLEIRVGYGPLDVDLGSDFDCSEFLKHHRNLAMDS